jgi:hypothetical protein
MLPCICPIKYGRLADPQWRIRLFCFTLLMVFVSSLITNESPKYVANHVKTHYFAFFTRVIYIFHSSDKRESL